MHVKVLSLIVVSLAIPGFLAIPLDRYRNVERSLPVVGGKVIYLLTFITISSRPHYDIKVPANNPVIQVRGVKPNLNGLIQQAQHHPPKVPTNAEFCASPAGHKQLSGPCKKKH